MSRSGVPFRSQLSIRGTTVITVDRDGPWSDLSQTANRRTGQRWGKSQRDPLTDGPTLDSASGPTVWNPFLGRVEPTANALGDHTRWMAARTNPKPCFRGDGGQKCSQYRA